MRNVKRNRYTRRGRGTALARSEAPEAETEIRPLLITILNMLELYTKEATIVLTNGDKVSINAEWEQRTQFHCPWEKVPCSEVNPAVGPSGERFGVCKLSAQTSNFSSQLEPVAQSIKEDREAKLRLLPVMSSDSSNEYRPLGETSETRSLTLDRIRVTIHALSAEEKATIIGAFTDSEFNRFLAEVQDVDTLESMRHGFTQRINSIRAVSSQARKNPVLETRKVGKYLYKLQSTPRGTGYWYLQFTEDGKRCSVYLGKQLPSFDPHSDLAKRTKPKAMQAHG